eukprot:TRINITY_DN5165_c0_g1_i1.p1 TRINITY_DN5165_c0_g1~~TRINITY_DN5165_c0_g1_i1.p1  ORF type:complete len:136 (+),score=20.35 TRINITY_DN5165_c0_g1_i1:63-470(+)
MWIVTISFIALLLFFVIKKVYWDKPNSPETIAYALGVPTGFHNYRTTQIFTKETVPAGLTRSHNTKQGVYGVISVLKGHLTLHHFDYEEAGLEERWEIIAAGAGGASGLVLPEAPHQVEDLSPDLQFQVQFWRKV